MLEGVRCTLAGNTLEVCGTDLDLTIRRSIEVAGTTDGEVVIPAKLATDIFRSLEPGAVDVAADDDGVKITSGRAAFSVRAHAADEFPQITEPTGTEATIDADVLRHALDQVVPAASSDDNRPILTGVLFAAESGGMRLVATDSYRLALCDLPGIEILGDDQKPLVPSRALDELAKILADVDEVTVTLGESDVAFDIGDSRLTTRLLQGEFPNYSQLIPASAPNRLTVSRDVLRDAIGRVKLLTQDVTTPVRLSMSGAGLELSVVSQERGEAHEAIDAKYEGADMQVAFNPEYLLKGISVCDGDEVIIETVDALKAATVRGSESDDFLYLLMPVRVT